MVFYRKYRPQTIDQLDSAALREKLFAVLSDSQHFHALLFTGPKGLGKTSTARIVAKAINCERNFLTINQESRTENKEKKVEPCNKCYSCVAITSGSSLDVLEIDAASNRGIDEIRDLREKARLAPSSSAKKVYIIDEVHMLTTEAFNALLKTLEEPPSHVMFVLCTTEFHKIPPTILSRCFHIPFSLATKEELVRSFKRIARGEKIEIDDDSLSAIAFVSDGSFRDGAKIFEELLLLSKDQKITRDLIERIYHTQSGSLLVKNLIQAFAKKDVKKGLEFVSEAVGQGINMRDCVPQLIEEIHKLLLNTVGVGKSDKANETSFSLEEIKQLLALLTSAYQETKYAVVQQLPLELVIIEWGNSAGSSLSGAEVSTSEGAQVGNSGESKSAELANENFLGSQAKEGKTFYQNNTSPRSATSENFISSPRHNNSVSSPRSTVTSNSSSDTDAFWQKLIANINTQNHSVAGLLRGCHIKSYDGKSLILSAKYTFHKEKLSEKLAFTLLQKTCENITGKKIDIKIVSEEVNKK